MQTRPRSRHSKAGPYFDNCADLLKKVYTSDTHPCSDLARAPDWSYDGIPEFTTTEVKDAIKQMAKGRTCDSKGVLLEMLLHGGDDLLLHLARAFNELLRSGDVPDHWSTSLLTLLHKEGDSNDPNNWRPVAIPSITYKILARVVYNRIKPTLESHQPEEQFGFRSKMSTTDAFSLLSVWLARVWNIVQSCGLSAWISGRHSIESTMVHSSLRSTSMSSEWDTAI